MKSYKMKFVLLYIRYLDDAISKRENVQMNNLKMTVYSPSISVSD